MSTYMTIQGDTWDNISKKNYGSELYINELIQANIAHIGVIVFQGGITLTIPNISINNPDISSIPPWRR